MGTAVLHARPIRHGASLSDRFVRAVRSDWFAVRSSNLVRSTARRQAAACRARGRDAAACRSGRQRAGVRCTHGCFRPAVSDDASVGVRCCFLCAWLRCLLSVAGLGRFCQPAARSAPAGRGLCNRRRDLRDTGHPAGSRRSVDRRDVGNRGGGDVLAGRAAGETLCAGVLVRASRRLPCATAARNVGRWRCRTPLAARKFSRAADGLCWRVHQPDIASARPVARAAELGISRRQRAAVGRHGRSRIATLANADAAMGGHGQLAARVGGLRARPASRHGAPAAGGAGLAGTCRRCFRPRHSRSRNGRSGWAAAAGAFRRGARPWRQHLDHVAASAPGCAVEPSAVGRGNRAGIALGRHGRADAGAVHAAAPTLGRCGDRADGACGLCHRAACLAAAAAPHRVCDAIADGAGVRHLTANRC